MKRGQTAIEALLALSIVLILATASFSGLNEETLLNNSAILSRECTLRAINDTHYNSGAVNTNNVMRITGITPSSPPGPTSFDADSAEMIVYSEESGQINAGSSLETSINTYCNGNPTPDDIISGFLENVNVSLPP